MTNETLVLRLSGPDAAAVTVALSLSDTPLEFACDGSLLAGAADDLGGGRRRVPGHGWAVLG